MIALLSLVNPSLTPRADALIRTALRQRPLVLAGSLRLFFTGWQILRQFPDEAPIVTLFAEQGGDEASKRGVVIWA